MHKCAALALSAVLGLATTLAQAGSIGVGPTRIELDASRQVQTLTVQNTGEAPTLLQVDVHRWQQLDSGDELTPAPELAATPRVFELKPGETRSVRVGLREQKPVSSEGAYRLYVREVQSGDAVEGPQLRYLVQVGIPVFVVPAGTSAAAVIGWTVDAREPGCARLRLVNDGKRRERLLAIDYRENGQSVWKSEVPQYLLAGTRRALSGSPCIDSRGAGELILRTELGEQRVARIPAER